MTSQFTLFGDRPAWPEGFDYAEEIISAHEEAQLLAEVRLLPFREFEFQGYIGKRRVISFGWKYDFTSQRLEDASPMPQFLLGVRDAAARFANVDPARLAHALVTEYSAGAAIGWHRDKAVFGDVIGISLLAPCDFRLRRKVGTKWERVTVEAQPRSAYLLRGPSRTEWEHSIPPVDSLRYSITFRDLRDGLKLAGR